MVQVGMDWVTLRARQNCTQDEVDMNLLRYLHTGPRRAASQDLFVFSLTDGENQSPSQHFHISLKEMEKGREKGRLCSCLKTKGFKGHMLYHRVCV